MHLKFLKFKVFNVPVELKYIFEDNEIEYKISTKDEDENYFYDEDKPISERGYLKKMILSR